MIGAMPAVAVRHERRRQENRIKRPSQLYLGGHWSQPPQVSPLTPNSYIQNEHIESLPEVYLCGKISGLHTVVICLLLGAIILVVGLVQLAPGATSDHKLTLLITGSLLLLLGLDVFTREGVLHDRVEFSTEMLPNGYTNERLISPIDCICLAALRCYLLHCTFISTESPMFSESHVDSENLSPGQTTSNL